MITIGIILILLIVYIFIIRPLHLKWGATNGRVKLALTGDEIVKKTHVNATIGISISASTEEIRKSPIAFIRSPNCFLYAIISKVVLSNNYRYETDMTKYTNFDSQLNDIILTWCSM